MPRPSLYVIVACACAIASSAVSAQTRTAVESTGEMKIPWGVAIQPSANTVAIGNCQLVYIELTDETGKDRARRPGGMLVGLADFDWSAAGEQPNIAVGKYDGPNSWSVCVCQGAVVGSMVTITAT